MRGDRLSPQDIARVFRGKPGSIEVFRPLDTMKNVDDPSGARQCFASQVHNEVDLEESAWAETAWFCRIQDEDACSASFTACQDLEIFQWKLEGFVAALQGNDDVLAMFIDRYDGLQDSHGAGLIDNSSSDKYESIIELNNVRRQLAFQQERIKSLGHRAQATAQLLQQTITLRHSDHINSLTHNLTALHSQSVETLQHLSTETTALASLSKIREHDAKMMKTLTAISTIYLPASLVASLFSSNLIQLLPKNAPSVKDMQLVLAPQMWIAVLLVGGLLLVTGLGIKVYEWVFRQARHSKVGWEHRRE
ncbi:MAG: hypothetical protein Q9159_004398 [Coniocarpon cinnabarinum]